MTAEIITLPGAVARESVAAAPIEMTYFEPCPIADVPAGELARVDVFGEFARLIFAIPERPFDGGRIQHVVCGKMLVPTSMLETIAEKIRAAAPSE